MVKSYAFTAVAATETEVAVKIPVTFAPEVLGETLLTPFSSTRSPEIFPVKSPSNEVAVTIQLHEHHVQM